MLKTLASPPNRRILVTLADQPAHGRDIAGRLALPESEVSRRLRSMERLGLVEGRWLHHSRNIKKYRPAAWAFQFRLDGDGIHVSTVSPWADACACGRSDGAPLAHS